MKRILCFGDSNTWGYVPASVAERYPANVRWTGILQSALDGTYQVIEEAQNGRTTVFDDPCETVCKNGAKHLPIILESQKPIDLVIVMLGTNDLKDYFNQTASMIAHAAGVLVERILASDAGPGKSAPKVLLISPAHVADSQCPFGRKFDGARAKSLEFAAAFRDIAQLRDVAFLDAAEFVTVPTTDCIHFDESGHAALGKAVAEKIQALGI